MTIRTLLFSILLFLSFSSLRAQTETIEAVMYLNSTVVEDILNEKEIEYEAVKHNLYRLTLKGYKVSLLIDEGDMILRTYFSEMEPSLNRVNDFNASFRWGRVYFDKDGDLTYAAELSFTGGIAEKGIHIFINTYGSLLETVIEKLNVD